MTLSIATWNINSVRLRLPLIERFLGEYKPDVLCLQETKCPDDKFPFKDFESFGYTSGAINGQKGYHGVATFARRDVELVEKREFCEMGDTRHVAVGVKAGGKSIVIHNFYVPAGGDIPDVEANVKFRHKLDFLAEMADIRAKRDGFDESVLVGDLNIAPLEHDVWSHKKMLKVVSHTPIETQTLEELRCSGEWLDLMRQYVSADEKLYTWWSYRARDWDGADKGRRLDHIWSSKGLGEHLTSIEVLRAARGWERPSDHVPVIAHFDLD